MSEKIIKNNLRSTIEEVKRSYIPEYQRLNTIPVPMIDNNHFVNVNNSTEHTKVIDDFSDHSDVESKKTSPKINDYILMVNGDVISTDSKENIQKQVQSILYNEHPNFLNKNLTIDNIVILKRVDIKFGVFLGE